MMRKSLFALSVALNVVLISYVSYSVVGTDNPRLAALNEASAPVQARGSSSALSTQSRASVVSAFQVAVDGGVDPSIAKAGLSAGLAQAALTLETDEYWRAPAVREYERARSLAEAQAAAREALLELFGPQAADDAVFAAVFKPYEQQYPFLSSAKQLALQALRLEQQHKLASAGAGVMTSGDHQQLQMQLKKLLSDEEYLEYRLRDSQEARYLSASGFDFTEAEFRKVLRAMPMNASGSAQPSGFGMIASGGFADSAVASALGSTRFAQFKRHQDPAYRLMLAVATQRQLSTAAVEAAYKVHEDHTAQMQRARLDASLDSPTRQQALSAATASRDRELRRLLGDEAFQDIARPLSLQLPSITPLMAGGIPVLSH